jgi:GDP-L-fucose synthase
MKLNKTDKIFVAGHRGMVGSAMVRALSAAGFSTIVTRSKSELDLTDNSRVKDFFRSEKPDIVLLAAARVGGIQANIDSPADFIYENVSIQSNVIHNSYLQGVKKLVFFGSSCMYPRECPQPMKEEYILDGKPEPTNEGYALAKITGMKMAQAYHKQYGLDVLNVIPCNLYGINDSFDPIKSHVLSALVRKFTDAKAGGSSSITLWGTGIARRELMHADDLADSVVFLMENYNSPECINIGPGTDISIRELAEKIREMTGFTGEIKWDSSKPDGMLRKCMDVTRLNALGFKTRISLEEGIKSVMKEYATFQNSQS